MHLLTCFSADAKPEINNSTIRKYFILILILSYTIAVLILPNYVPKDQVLANYLQKYNKLVFQIYYTL